MNPLHDALLFVHFIGLAMAVGAGFAKRALGGAAAGLEPAERTAFMLRTLAVSKVASWGLVLLIASGIALWVQAGAIRPGFFHLKLLLVGVQVGLFGYAQMLIAKIKKASGGPAMAKMPLVGSLLLGNALLIVLTAVLTFH